MNPAVQKMATHILTTAGGGLVAHGLANSDDVNTAAGAVITILGFAWSVYQHIKASKAATAAQKGT